MNFFFLFHHRDYLYGHYLNQYQLHYHHLHNPPHHHRIVITKTIIIITVVDIITLINTLTGEVIAIMTKASTRIVI